MPSLLNDQPVPAQGPPAQQQGQPPPSQEAEIPEGGRRATPEQESQFNKFVSAGTKLLSSQDVTRDIAAQAQAEDPRDAVGKIVVQVLTRLEKKASEDTQLDPEAVMHAGHALTQKAMGILEQEGGQKFSEEEKFQAFIMMAATYMQDAIDTGKLSPEEYEELSQAIQQTPEGKQIAEQLTAMQGQEQQQVPQGAPEAPGGMPGQPPPRPEILGG